MRKIPLTTIVINENFKFLFNEKYYYQNFLINKNEYFTNFPPNDINNQKYSLLYINKNYLLVKNIIIGNKNVICTNMKNNEYKNIIFKNLIKNLKEDANIETYGNKIKNKEIYDNLKDSLLCLKNRNIKQSIFIEELKDSEFNKLNKKGN